MISAWISDSVDAISHSPVENVRILFFDQNDTMLAKWHYSIGNRHMVPCKTSFVVDMALECEARSFVMLHNHPSGCCLPSDNDVRFTEQLKTHALQNGVRLIDHIVCAASGTKSILDSLCVKADGIDPTIPRVGEYAGCHPPHGGDMPTSRRSRRSRAHLAEMTAKKLALPNHAMGGAKS